jgi:tripartite-type tricarboxylate transporter receptor subunit TctC
MQVSRRRLLHLAAGAALFSGPLRAANAETYPASPIRLVIPYPPGGVNDAVGRPWADKMKTLLGTIVVENIGGDGYTILLGNTGTQIIHPLATSKPTYDPVTSFAPISILGSTAVGIVTNTSVDVKTLKEFISYAKANSGKLSYGSPGVGTLSHLTAELFKSLSGTPDILHVPYRGIGPAMTDLLAGRFALMTPNITGNIIALHRAGKLRLLAVTSPTRLSAAPDIPTAVESGLAGMVSQNFIGLFAPAQTSSAIVDQISKNTNTALADLRPAYVASGFEPNQDSSPAKAQQFIKEQVAMWGPVIKKIDLRID